LKEGGPFDPIKEGVKLRFDEDAAPAEVSYLLLSHGGMEGRVNSLNDYQRVGRWTKEEWDYCAFLCQAFERGVLPIQTGLKLGEFLGEVLLCKNSRLTKKMKHAKFSLRSYTLYPTNLTGVDAKEFSVLEHRFLGSLPSAYVRLEISFHLKRLWQAHLANFSFKTKSKLVDATDWFKGHEEMEVRGLEVEEFFRNWRGARMSKALQMESTIATFTKRSASDFAPMNVPNVAQTEVKRLKVDASHNYNVDPFMEEPQDKDYLYNLVDSSQLTTQEDDEEYSKILNELMDNSKMQETSLTTQTRNEPSPQSSFFEQIRVFMQEKAIPFQHADIWVPAPQQDISGAANTVLLHVGSVTRTDIPGDVFAQIDTLSVHSPKVSFSAGSGFPGRVFSKRKVLWETNLPKIDPRFSKDSMGSIDSAIKMGLGFEFVSGTGHLIVCFYSTTVVERSLELLSTCRLALSDMSPRIKWRPTVESTSDGAMSPLSSPQVREERSGTRTLSESSLSRSEEYDSGSTITESDLSRSLGKKADRKIANLLGVHMPSSLAPQTEQMVLTPYFMSLRLLLLKTPERRSQEEEDMLDIVRKSYHGHIRNRKRSEEEIANLVVRDWQFLVTIRVNPLPAQPPTTPSGGVATAPLISKPAAQAKPPML
jgi:hypothetical protein